MFKREDLEQMTVRQLRLIDIKEVEDEAMVQEVLNKKLIASGKIEADVYRGDMPNIETPEQEAAYQKVLDERLGKRKSLMGVHVPGKEDGPGLMDVAAPKATSEKVDVPIAPSASDASEVNLESPKMIDHVVSKEDLENNPELKEQGVKVGETIQIPAVDDSSELQDEGQPEKPLDKMNKGELVEYAKSIDLEFGPDIKNNAQRIEAIEAKLKQ